MACVAIYVTNSASCHIPKNVAQTQQHPLTPQATQPYTRTRNRMQSNQSSTIGQLILPNDHRRLALSA